MYTSFIPRPRDIVNVLYLLFRLNNYKEPPKLMVQAARILLPLYFGEMYPVTYMMYSQQWF